MGDYDGHSSRGDSDLGLATGHLWSAAPGGSLDTDKTQAPDPGGGYIWSGQMLGWRQGRKSGRFCNRVDTGLLITATDRCIISSVMGKMLT